MVNSDHIANTTVTTTSEESGVSQPRLPAISLYALVDLEAACVS